MSIHPSRAATAFGVALALVATGVAGAAPAHAATSVQAAIDAAPVGGTVRLAPGTYSGGVTIDKSLTLVGAGAGRTTLRGGDSVIRVASPAGSAPPTVTIADLTLTGGVAHGAPATPADAFGGGLLVEGQGDGVGARVLLRHAAVVGNRAVPLETVVSPRGATCPGGPCPYALAAGGGIASFGDLTIDHSLVRGNAATGRSSDAQGGGVWTSRGHLRILSSSITGNRAEPRSIGRYAEGGGVFTDEARTGAPPIPLTIADSHIDHNTALLDTRWPVKASPDAEGPIGMIANAGGLHVGSGYATTVDRSTISRNRLAAIDPVGEPVAFDSGVIQAFTGTFTMRRSHVDGNSAKVVAATADDVLTSGTAVEIDGVARFDDTTISRNTADASGTAGSAWVSNGLAVLAADAPGQADLRRVSIVGNTASARSSTGAARVLGVGVLNNSLLTMTDTVVARNRGKAVSSDASAQGGGIWNGAFLSGPPVQLTAHRSLVTGNSVAAPGGTAAGGGIFHVPGDGVGLTLDRTPVVGNAPDQCAGCTATAAPQATSAPQAKSAPQARVAPRFRRSLEG